MKSLSDKYLSINQICDLYNKYTIRAFKVSIWILKLAYISRKKYLKGLKRLEYLK